MTKETKKEYSIKEALDMLDISRATFYNKLNRYGKELKPHMASKNGKKYISIDGIEFLKNLDNYIDEPDNCIDNLNNCLDGFDNSDNRRIMILLEEQLNVKDSQIKSLSDALAVAHKLNENNQILLNQAQQKILYLEQANDKSYWWQFWKKK